MMNESSKRKDSAPERHGRLVGPWWAIPLAAVSVGCGSAADSSPMPAGAPTQREAGGVATTDHDVSPTPVERRDASTISSIDASLVTVTGDGAAPGMAPCNRDIQAVVRDFRGCGGAAGPRHPDFEGNFVSYRGIVKEALGADQKPVYANPGSTPATTGPAEFDQWYRDVDGVNLRFADIAIPLREDPARPGTFFYDNQAFFPIDGRGFGDCFGPHNFHFTTEIHLQFSYQGGEVFTFRGDDDLFLFINGHLAMDLGGVHPPQMGTVDLDAQATMLDIARGRTYPMDIFHAERHTEQSTFRVETTLQCFTSVIVR